MNCRKVYCFRVSQMPCLRFASAVFALRKCRVCVSQMPCLRFASAVFALRKCRVCASQVPCLRFASGMFALRKWHVCVSQVPCLRFASAVFALRKWHVNASLMACLQSSSDGGLGLQNMLCKGCKNVKTEAFLPRFCINIQNDRMIVNGALFFHNV